MSPGRTDAPHATVTLGSLVLLEDDAGATRTVFVGPAAGGLIVKTPGGDVTVVTPDAPLGRALLTTGLDDEITVDAGGRRVTWYITDLA